MYGVFTCTNSFPVNIRVIVLFTFSVRFKHFPRAWLYDLCSFKVVFTVDGVGVGVLSASNLVKIENQRDKRSQNGSIFFRFRL